MGKIIAGTGLVGAFLYVPVVLVLFGMYLADQSIEWAIDVAGVYSIYILGYTLALGAYVEFGEGDDD